MEVDHGFIYLMKNKAMPNIYKIGLTRRPSIDLRVKELSSTSVSFDFEVLDHKESHYCGQLEAYLHSEFKLLRLNNGKEFFKFSCDDDAIANLNKAVGEFVPDTSANVEVKAKPRKEDTAAKKAKALGAKSLAQVAEVYGCTPTNLDYMSRNHPVKFEIVVLGVLAKVKKDEN